MRVILVHNPEAGSGSPTRAELTTWLSDAGYEVRYLPAASADFPGSLADPGDLVIVAGGDGTVADVVREVSGRDVPVAVLPLGKANNIAHALGISGSPTDIIGRLRCGAPRTLDVGSARAPWGVQRFVESAGLGLFAHVLLDAEREEATAGHDAASHDLVNARGERMQKVLSLAHPVHRRVLADGIDLSDEYLFVAAFNIPFIGPRLRLAPDADPGDGRLDLLLLREADRDRLAEYLEQVSDGLDARLSIGTRRCEEIVIGWDSSAGHLDDSVWPRRAQSRDATNDMNADVVLTLDGRVVQVLGASAQR